MTNLEKNTEELAYKWWHSVDKEFVDVIDAYKQGYKQGYNDAIDKACDAYCRLCDTKECGDTGECVWVEKFRKRLMR